VALVLQKGTGDDVSRVSPSTRTIAVVMPNRQGIRNDDWQNYLVSVDTVEALSGYDLFSNVPVIIQNSIEAGVDGVNPPGVADQLVTTNEDTQKQLTLEAVSPNGNPLVYTLLSQPTHGTLTGSDGGRTYTPAPDFNGTDAFTFRVSDGVLSSNTATVTIRILEVNDAPSAVADAKVTDEDTPLSFPAADLTANDTAGPENENGQTLTVTSVSATDGHGTVALSNGQITYTPAANFNGTASFTYQVCDDGISGGLPDPLCATSSVAVSINAVNDPPVFTAVPAAPTTNELAAYTFTARADDVDGQPLTFSLVGAPDGATIDPVTGQFSWTPTETQGGLGVPYIFKVRVSDGLAAAEADVSVTVSEVNQSPTLALLGNKTVFLGDTLAFTAIGSDVDIPVQTLSYGLSAAAPAGAAINPATGAFAWTPTGAQAGSTYAFDVMVTDGVSSISGGVTVSVIDKTPPAMSPLTLSTTVLWPPDHEMSDVSVAYDASDYGDPAPACSLSVSSNEPVNGTGDGDTAPDWEVVDAHHVRLRAERAGGGDGRIYTIVAGCHDRFGNASQRTAAVTVPKSQGKGK
jgi:hypothetical protein